MIITCQLRNCFNGIAIETECFDGFSGINSIWKDSRNGAIRSSSHRTPGVPYSGPHRTQGVLYSSLTEHREEEEEEEEEDEERRDRSDEGEAREGIEGRREGMMCGWEGK